MGACIKDGNNITSWLVMKVNVLIYINARAGFEEGMSAVKKSSFVVE